MKVLIPSKNRQETISTHKIFPDSLVLVHDNQQKRLYARNSSIPMKRIVVTNAKPDSFGLTRQREWATKKLVDPGEWFVFADDNIKSLSWLPLPYYRKAKVSSDTFCSIKEARDVFRTECSWEDFKEVVFPDTVAYAKQVGARMCGFALVDNYFFRFKKFRSIGYVIGKMMIMKNERLTFDHTITMEDFRNTADHLLRFGSVAINNFMFPVANHYQKGGMGSYDERIPFRKMDVRRLLFLYGNLFRIKDRKGFESNTDLQIAIHNRDSLEQWRKETYARWNG